MSVDGAWVAVVGAAVAAAWLVARVVEWGWWRPRRLERALRAQGLRGTRYQLFGGDIKEEIKMRREAQRKPISPFSHCVPQRIFPFLLQAMNTYGKMSITWVGPSPRVSIMDPAMIKEILSNKHGQFKRTRTNILSTFLATGLLTIEGEKWTRHRKIMNPAFHIEKLKRILPAFSLCCDELITRWEKLVGSEGSCELDVWPELQSFTGDVISRAAFGSSYAEGCRIFQLQSEQAKLVIQANRSAYVPGYRLLPTKDNNRMREIYREVRAIMRTMIERRKRDTREGKDCSDDLLGLLMESNLRESEETGESKNAAMSTDDVIEECKLFYFAGQETTSTLLTWTMIVLSMHPSWQERAREEVLGSFGNEKPNFDDLNHLKIVTMILYEVLRLYPPLMVLRRITCKEVKLGEITFPPEVHLLIPALLLHHDTELWGEDASEFRPERFAEGISKATRNQASFLSFGGGQRICIGQNFAMLEARMGLARILKHFSFELSPSYTHAPQAVILVQPQYGAQLILHKL